MSMAPALPADAPAGLVDREADATLDSFARLAAALLQAPTAYVTLVARDAQLTPGAATGQDRASPPRGSLDLQESICQFQVVTGEPLFIGDTRTDPLSERKVAIRDGSRGGVWSFLGPGDELPGGVGDDASQATALPRQRPSHVRTQAPLRPARRRASSSVRLLHMSPARSYAALCFRGVALCQPPSTGVAADPTTPYRRTARARMFCASRSVIPNASPTPSSPGSSLSRWAAQRRLPAAGHPKRPSVVETWRVPKVVRRTR